MTTYLIPGVMRESVAQHFQRNGIASEVRSITQPRSVQGYTVPQEEVGCGQFLFDAGLTREAFNSAQPTNEADLFLVSANGAAPAVRNRRRSVNYSGSPRVLDLLNRLATEHQADIVCVRPNPMCFADSTAFPTCQECNVIRDPDDESVITIHFNCANRGRANNPPLASLYEFTLGGGPARQVKKFPLTPICDGQVVFDPNGTPVAEVVDSSIYILVNLEASEYDYWSYNDRRYWRHNAEVLERILAAAIPIALGITDSISAVPRYQIVVERRRNQLQPGLEKAVESYLAQAPNLLPRRIEELERTIRNLSQDAEEALDTYLHSQQQIQEEQQTLNALRGQSHGGDQELRQQLANILAMPDVIGIKFSDHLEVYTDTAFICWEGHEYRIGAFRLDIHRNQIRIKNLSNEGGDREYDHPHVIETRPCLGNISEAVPEMLRDGQIEMLVNILIQYLKSYNPNSPYRTIENWPRVS